jgi:hypothetical protein
MRSNKGIVVEKVIKVGNLEQKEFLANDIDIYFHPDKDKAVVFSDKGKAQEAIDNVLSRWYINSDRKPIFNIIEV